MKKIPFMNLKITDKLERDKLNNTFIRLMNHGQYLMGKEVDDFENKISKYCYRKYCVGVSSGTDALYTALRAVGVGVGDEVITTSLSWIATTNAITMTGATPIFADIKNDLNIDANSVESLITENTKAILPVHYTGRAVEIDEFSEIKKKYNIKLIYDAAQAFGSIYKDKPIGYYGDISCFSMNPMKTLGACGEAGAIVTDDNEIYERIKILRYNGTVNKEVCVEPSLNGRIDALQAAILVDRLEFLDEKIEKRQKIAEYYDELLEGVVVLPKRNSKDNISSYYSYTIQTNYRDGLAKYLLENGVETKILHPILMCDQLPYKNNTNNTSINARDIVKQILSLPASEKVEKKDVEYIASLIKEYIKFKE